MEEHDVKKAYEEGLAAQAKPADAAAARVLIAGPRRRASSLTHWYAVWTRSRHEQVVREQLERKHFEAFLPTITAVEPLEGSEEEDRLAAVPGLLLRSLRSRRHAADPEVRRRREHRLV